MPAQQLPSTANRIVQVSFELCILRSILRKYLMLFSLLAANSVLSTLKFTEQMDFTMLVEFEIENFEISTIAFAAEIGKSV